MPRQKNNSKCCSNKRLDRIKRLIQESCRKSFVLSRLTAFMTALYYRVVRLNDEYFPGLKLIDCQLRLRFDRVLVFLPVKIILDWLFILMFVTKVNSEPNLPIFWLSVIHRHNKLLNRLRKDSKLQRRNSSILSLNGSTLLNWSLIRDPLYPV